MRRKCNNASRPILEQPEAEFGPEKPKDEQEQALTRKVLPIVESGVPREELLEPESEGSPQKLVGENADAVVMVATRCDLFDFFNDEDAKNVAVQFN